MNGIASLCVSLQLYIDLIVTYSYFYIVETIKGKSYSPQMKSGYLHKKPETNSRNFTAFVVLE